MRDAARAVQHINAALSDARKMSKQIAAARIESGNDPYVERATMQFNAAVTALKRASALLLNAARQER